MHQNLTFILSQEVINIIILIFMFVSSHLPIFQFKQAAKPPDHARRVHASL